MCEIRDTSGSSRNLLIRRPRMKNDSKRVFQIKDKAWKTNIIMTASNVSHQRRQSLSLCRV